MTLLTKSSFLGLALGAGLLLAGCQASGVKSVATTTPTTQALACGQCKMVTVREPRKIRIGKTDHTVGYRTRQAMKCPECKDAVESLFATGKFQHTCKICGDAMAACEGHEF